jgi:pteridine reductase
MPEHRPLALITGAARRVGRAASLALARDGCDILITYRTSEDEATGLLAELRRLGVEASAERLDLDDLEQTMDFAESLARARPALDVLVHNASIYQPSPFGEITADHALRHYRVNALAPLLLTQGCAPALNRSTRPGGASVVAMCDIHAMGRPRKDFAAYTLSKAALVEMVRSLARDLAPRVRVNGVAPGVVAFPESGYESDDETQRRYLSRVPLDRSGTPEDAAEAVRWLALDAHYTTGTIIRVDGGRFLA